MASETGVIIHNISKKRYLASLKLLSTFQQKKTRQYTTLILTFVALIVFGVFAINPTISTIIQLRRELEDSKILDKKLDEKIIALQTLQRQYQELEADLPLLVAALPVAPETPKIIGQIQSLIKDNNLTIENIDMKRVAYTKDGLPQGELGTYVITFTIAGNYSDINQFSNQAVDFDRVVTVDQVSVLRDSQNASIIRSTAEVRAYFDQVPL